MSDLHRYREKFCSIKKEIDINFFLIKSWQEEDDSFDFFPYIFFICTVPVQPALCFLKDLLMLCIRPTNIVYLTCRRVQPWLKKAGQPPQSVGNTNFFNEACIRHTVHRTNSSLKLLKNHVRVGPKYRRTELTLGGCNTIPEFTLNVADIFRYNLYNGMVPKT